MSIIHNIMQKKYKLVPASIVFVVLFSGCALLSNLGGGNSFGFIIDEEENKYKGDGMGYVWLIPEKENTYCYLTVILEKTIWDDLALDTTPIVVTIDSVSYIYDFVSSEVKYYNGSMSNVSRYEIPLSDIERIVTGQSVTFSVEIASWKRKRKKMSLFGRLDHKNKFISFVEGS